MEKDHPKTRFGTFEARVCVATLAIIAGIGACMMPTRYEAPVISNYQPRSFVQEAPQKVEWEGREKNNVVLVVIDGARAQEVFEGTDLTLASHRGFHDLASYNSGAHLMPELHAWLREEGTALGALSDTTNGVFASGPNYVSLPGYFEILTGHAQPHCQNNECGPVREKTILDEARERTGVRDAVAAFTSWPLLGRGVARTPDAIVVSAGVDFPFGWAELHKTPTLLRTWQLGRPTDSYPGDKGYRADAYTAKLALRYIEARQPRLTFLSLGDTDEYAHKNDYRGYIKALQHADSTLGALRKVLREAGDWGKRTTVIVTSDHGRANDFRNHGGAYPESARSFVIALGGLAKHEGIVAAITPHRLADIAPTVRHILRLPARDLTPSPGTALSELIASEQDRSMASHDSPQANGSHP